MQWARESSSGRLALEPVPSGHVAAPDPYVEKKGGPGGRRRSRTPMGVRGPGRQLGSSLPTIGSFGQVPTKGPRPNGCISSEVPTTLIGSSDEPLTANTKPLPVRLVLPRPKPGFLARRKSPTNSNILLGTSSRVPLEVFDQRKSPKTI